MKKTLLAHLYNEEYLLPFWLEHHRDIFDKFILIDYNSTDNSLIIIKEFLKNKDFKILQSRNQYFDAGDVDEEVTDIEKEIVGNKITLNITEFLYFNEKFEQEILENNITGIHVCVGCGESEPHTYREFQSDLKNNIIWGLNGQPTPSSEVWTPPSGGNYRFMHNISGELNKQVYSTGRHNLQSIIYQEKIPINKIKNTTNAFICKVTWFPWNEKTLKRKMQIQEKMSYRERYESSAGFQHKGDKKFFIKNFMQTNSLHKENFLDIPIVRECFQKII